MSDTTMVWNSDIGIPLSDHLRQQANAAVVAMANDSGPHQAAVRGLAELVATKERTDPLLWTIARAAAITGPIDDFQPSSTVSQLLMRLGTDSPVTPPAETTFAELVAAAVQDACETLEKLAQNARSMREQTEAQFNTLQLDAKNAAEEDLIELRQRVDELTTENGALQASVDYLRDFTKQTEKIPKRRKTTTKKEAVSA